MIPKTAVFVIGNNDDHVAPLRAFLEMRNQVGDVRVTLLYVGVTSVFVQVALRFVEGHLFQSAGVNRCQKGGAIHSAVLQMLGALGRAGSHAGEIVERLMMVLKI